MGTKEIPGQDGAEGDGRREGSAGGSASTTAELAEDEANAELAGVALDDATKAVGLNLDGLVLRDGIDGLAAHGVGEEELSAYKQRSQVRRRWQGENGRREVPSGLRSDQLWML